MKSKLFLIPLLLNLIQVQIIYAQTNRPNSACVTYNVSYSKNSILILEDECQLDITASSSHFYSLSKFKNDKAIENALKESLEKGTSFNIIGKNNKKEFPFQIQKDFPNRKVIVFEEIGEQNFGYIKDSTDFNNWRILADTLTINKLLCYKAEFKKDTNITIAWYCPDIPFQYGPIIYMGLPGLITKIESSTGWAAYLTSINYNCSNTDFLQIPKYTLVSEFEFNKAKKGYQEMMLSNKQISNNNGNISIKRH